MITLNLLPAADKATVLRQAVLRRWRSAVAIFFVVTIVAGLGLEAERFLLRQHQRDVSLRLGQLQAEAARSTSADITETTQRLNRTVTALNGVSAHPRSWARDVSAVLAALPNTVTLSRVSLAADGVLTLEGVTTTRATFLSLQQLLTSSPLLTSVSTNSTASKRDNVPFLYTAVVKASPQ